MRIETLRFAPRGNRATCYFDQLSGQANVVLNRAGAEAEAGFSNFLRQALEQLFLDPQAVGPATSGVISGASGEMTYTREGIRRSLRLHPNGNWERTDPQAAFFQATSQPYAAPYPQDILGLRTIFLVPTSQVSTCQDLLAFATGRGHTLQVSTLSSPRRQLLLDRIATLRRNWQFDGITLATTSGQLHARRQHCQKKVDELQVEKNRRQSAWDAHESARRSEALGLRGEVDRLHAELRVCEDRVTDRQSLLDREYHRLEEGRRRLFTEREGERNNLEGCLRNAVEMRRQMESRARTLEDRLRNAPMRDDSLAPSESDGICLVETLSRQLGLWRDSDGRVRDATALDVSRIPYAKHPHATTLGPSVPSLEELRKEVFRLCQLLQNRRARDREEVMRDELGHIEQCLLVLDDWSRDLEKQKQSIELELGSMQLHGTDYACEQEGGRNVADYLDDYGRVVPDRLVAVVHTCDQQHPLRSEDDYVLRDLKARRDQVRKQLDEAQRRLHERDHHRLDAGLPGIAEINLEIERLLREIADIESRLRSWDELQALESELARLQDEVRVNPFTSRVNELVTQLTSGRWQRVQDVPGAGLQLASDQGQWISVNQTDHSIQQRLYLSLRLALAEQMIRQGSHYPMVISESQTQCLSSQELGFLAEFANRLGCQVFLVIGQAHRELAHGLAGRGIRVFELLQEVAAQPQGFVEQVRFEPISALKGEAFPYVPPSESRPPRTFEYVHEQGEPRKYRIDTAHGEESSGFSERTRLSHTHVIPMDVAHYLASIGIHTVGDFLAAVGSHSETEARAWNVPVNELRRWRQMLSFRRLLPELSAADVRVLVGCGIHHPSSLADADERRLHEAVQHYLNRVPAMHEGTLQRSRYSQGRLANWIRYARSVDARRRSVSTRDEFGLPRERSIYRERPRRKRGLEQMSRRRRPAISERPRAPLPVSKRQRTPMHRARTHVRSRSESNPTQSSHGPRFYLNPQDSILDAPSIGSKTAALLEAQGIRTIQDFLNCDPTDLSARLNLPRLKPDTLLEWQQQTMLVTRVPELRGHDAQILIACGIRTVEELASFASPELWARIRPFTMTSECKRLVRGGKLPDETEIADWIRSAKQARAISNQAVAVTSELR